MLVYIPFHTFPVSLSRPPSFHVVSQHIQLCLYHPEHLLSTPPACLASPHESCLSAARHPETPRFARDRFPIQKKPAKTSVLCSNHLLFLKSPSGARLCDRYHHGYRDAHTIIGVEMCCGLICLPSHKAGWSQTWNRNSPPDACLRTHQLGRTRILRPSASSVQKAANQPPSPHTTAAGWGEIRHYTPIRVPHNISLSSHFSVAPCLPAQPRGLRATLGPPPGPGEPPAAGVGAGDPRGNRSQPSPRPRLHKIEFFLRASLECFLSPPGRASRSPACPGRGGQHPPPPCARCPTKFPPNFYLKKKKLPPRPFLHMKSPGVPQQSPSRRLPSRRGRCPRGGQAEAAAKPWYLLRPGAGGVLAAAPPPPPPPAPAARPPARLALWRGRRREGGRKRSGSVVRRLLRHRARRLAQGPPGLLAGPRRALATVRGCVWPGAAEGDRPWAAGLARPLAFLPRADLSRCPPPCPGHGAFPAEGDVEGECEEGHGAAWAPSPARTHSSISDWCLPSPRAVPTWPLALRLFFFFFKEKTDRGSRGGWSTTLSLGYSRLSVWPRPHNQLPCSSPGMGTRLALTYVAPLPICFQHRFSTEVWPYR